MLKYIGRRIVDCARHILIRECFACAHAKTKGLAVPILLLGLLCQQAIHLT